jgi:hypothetical protein
MSPLTTRLLETDRVGGARSDDRQAGKGTASPDVARIVVATNEDGCGNGVPVESTNRFPQGLGNLAQNARFPHFHKPITFDD